MKIIRLYVAAAAILTAGFAWGWESGNLVAVKAKTILRVGAPVVQNGVILIEDGKIIQIGSDLNVPPEAEWIDFEDGWIMPGMIESHTSLGTGDSPYGSSGTDETSNPNTAQILMADGINPFSKTLKPIRMAGVTTIMVSPGRSNVIGGQPVVLKLQGNTVEEMILRNPSGVKFSLGEGPKATYGSKGRLPSTRMGSAYVVRNAFLEAREYLQSRLDYGEKKKKEPDAVPPKRDLRLEALAGLLEGKSTAFLECYRADDIMTALRLIDEFKIRGVLVGCAEAYLVAEEISRRNVPVILGSFGVGPRRMETRNLRRKSAVILSRAGVKLAIHAEESLGIGHLRELPLQAALAVREGLDRDTAIRAVTLTPAEILGIDDRVGSLEPGKDADLVIFSGDPLYYRSRVVMVMINGRIVHRETLETVH